MVRMIGSETDHPGPLQEQPPERVSDPEEDQNRDRDTGGDEARHRQETRVILGFFVHSIDARLAPVRCSPASSSATR